MELNTVVSEIKGKVGIITLNRTKALNAVSEEMLRELTSQTKAFDEDPWVRAIIIRGSDKAFAAGIDVRDLIEKVNSRDTELLKMHKYMETFAATRKPLIAAVAGFALGIGCEIALNCDIILAADNAKFGQTGPKVGSFDGGLGSSYLARIVGQKKAREIWYLCRQYDAREALDMGLVNTVVPLEKLEEETLSWCRQMLRHSPLALRCLKASLNADCDGQMGLLDLAGNATLLYYMSEEAKEGKNAFVEKRAPDFSKFPRLP